SVAIVWVPGAMYCCSRSKIAFDLGPGISVFTEDFLAIVLLSMMFLCLSIDKLCYVVACLRANGRKAGPVVEVNNRNTSVPADDRIASVHEQAQYLRGSGRKAAEFFLFESRLVDAVEVIPMKEIGLPNGIKFHRISVEVF